MADRFPLIVNAVSQKIEELVAGDNLELTGNGIIVGGDTGAGKYLTSDGFTVSWGSPGNVYLTQTQTLTNKTLETCSISGAVNTLTNIPNSALLNSGITVNGTTIDLGGSVTTPNDDTLYVINAVDGLTAQEKIIRLTASGSGSGTDDVVLKVGSPATIPSGSKALSLALSRSGDVITISGTVPDDNTITTLQSATGGTAQSGNIIISATGASTVSQDAATKTITIDTVDNDTITRLRATTGQTFAPGNFTFLATGAASISQGIDGNSDPTITIDATNTVTRIKGGTTGTLTSGDVTFVGGSSGNTTVSQSGSTITIDSTDTNTVTRLATGSNTVQSGDFKFVASGATSIQESTNAGVTTITISSVNTDTGAGLTASSGIIQSSGDFQLKNAGNFTGNTLLKWDSGNNQLANSLIADDGSTVTITGDLVVDGTQTVLNTQTLVVEDNTIELRKGNNLTGSDGGIQINRTTNSGGSVVTYQQLQWYESGAYWRSWDGSIEKRFVTETDTQTLTNKTLTSPTLTSPVLGAATATSINGLEITSTASATLDISSSKTLDVNRDLVLTSDDNSNSVTVNFRTGGNVAYTSDTLASFSSTTSTQLRGLISDTTGLDRLVFQTSPTILTSLVTTSSGFTLFNSGATAITAFGAATGITMGATSGTTTIKHNLQVDLGITVGTETGGTVTGGNITLLGYLNSDKQDISIRGTGTDPMRVGRGSSAINTNTALGVRAIQSATSGSQNTAIGFETLFTTNAGAANTAIGNRALRANGVGNNNVAVGRDSQLVNLDGDNNISLGNNTLASNNSGSNNVCIGHYAGYAMNGGSGNVLIGPADNENGTDATYVAPFAGGDRQLVIGSGTEAWIRGDNTFKVTIPNDFTVDGDTLIQGNLTVNGTTTTVNSNVVEIDDKEITLAAVDTINFTAVTIDGSSTITAVTPTAGLIPGMEVGSLTGGISVPVGTTIVSITGNQAVLSASVTGNGTATFTSPGATDLTANGGGIRVRGTTDKTITYDHSRTDKYWTFSENLEIAFGKKFVIGNQLALSTTTLGPTVVNSSLTSVGTLTSLVVDGSVTIGGVVTEKVFNNYTTSLTPNAGTLTINLAGSNTFVGTPATSAINTWDFTGVGLTNGQSKTITLILASNTAATYGDACSVDGNAVTNGVQWSGGSPPIATSNTDILTFVIVRDGTGTIKVFGQGNTDFS